MQNKASLSDLTVHLVLSFIFQKDLDFSPSNNLLHRIINYRQHESALNSLRRLHLNLRLHLDKTRPKARIIHSFKHQKDYSSKPQEVELDQCPSPSCCRSWWMHLTEHLVVRYSKSCDGIECASSDGLTVRSSCRTVHNGVFVLLYVF